MLVGTGSHALVRAPKGALFNLYHVLFRKPGTSSIGAPRLDPRNLRRGWASRAARPSETPQRLPSETDRSDRGRRSPLVCHFRPTTGARQQRGSRSQRGVRGGSPTCAPGASGDATFPQWLEVDLCGELNPLPRLFGSSLRPRMLAVRRCEEPIVSRSRHRATARASKWSPFSREIDDRDIQYYEVFDPRAQGQIVIRQRLRRDCRRTR